MAEDALLHDWIQSGASKGRRDWTSHKVSAYQTTSSWLSITSMHILSLCFFWLIHTVYICHTCGLPHMLIGFGVRAKLSLSGGQSAPERVGNQKHLLEFESSTAESQKTCHFANCYTTCSSVLGWFHDSFTLLKGIPWRLLLLLTTKSLVLPFYWSVTKQLRFAGSSLWFNDKCSGSSMWLE